MKTLIITKEKDNEWLRNIFPSYHPLLVQLCNKPFIEFLVDFSILAGSTAIRIVSDGIISDIESFCDNGSQWGINISYANMQPTDDIQKVIDKNRKFCADERIMIINSILFIRYNINNDYKSYFLSLQAGDIYNVPTGSISLTGVAKCAGYKSLPPLLDIPLLNSVGMYYTLAQEILHTGLSQYVLPGYNNEPDCYIGRNVVIQKSAEIVKPVILGNNVQIHAGAAVGPGTVIGSNVIIDKESTVTDSIVMDNTFIGEHLELDKKIAAGNLLVDPESGSSLLLEDPHILSGIRAAGTAWTPFQYLNHSFLAIILISILSFPYLLLRPLLGLQKLWLKRNVIFHASRPGRTLTLTTITIEKRGIASRIASILSLDRYTMLFSVLKGNLYLIGSKPLPINQADRNKQNSLSYYKPGVFSYAEAEDWPENAVDSQIVDHYYSVHSTLFKDIFMIQKALFNRIH